MVGVNFEIETEPQSVESLIPSPTWGFGTIPLGIEVQSCTRTDEMAWLTGIVGQETGQVFAAYVSAGRPDPVGLREAFRPQLVVHLTSVLRPRVLWVGTDEVTFPHGLRQMLAQHHVPIDDQLTFLPGTNPIEVVANLILTGVLGCDSDSRNTIEATPVHAQVLHEQVIGWLKQTYHQSPLRPFADVSRHYERSGCGRP